MSITVSIQNHDRITQFSIT